MSIRRFVSRLAGVSAVLAAAALPVRAQSNNSPPPPEQREPAPPSPDPHAGHDMSRMSPQQDHEGHEGHDMTSMAREGSGTSWMPDTTPVYAFHATRAGWQLMAHENLFVQVLHESGDRGATQGGSINWFMGMAERQAGPGRLAFRGMVSLEPFTIRGCGYPDLLASGERCDGAAIHDRQHPHDLFMELAARYDAPLASGLRWQVYGGPAGEPALGPAAFPHRVSALVNPVAPISHHWLDATHVTFGVVSGGIYGAKWKAEGSLFNGREPDQDRTGFDLAALDSVSARVSFLPIPQLVLQVSTGRLAEAEPAHGDEPARNVTRTTASAIMQTGQAGGTRWAATAAWGRNTEGGRASNAVLLETTLTMHERDTWFGRFETAAKTGHDLALGFGDEQEFTVAKLQGGYVRFLPPARGFQLGFGGALSAGFVPDALRSSYGGRVNPGIAAFLTLRPAALVR
jgi:hypothetical protein